MKKTILLACVVVIGVVIISVFVWIRSDEQDVAESFSTTSALKPLASSSDAVAQPVLTDEEIKQRVKQGTARRKFARLDETKLKQAVVKTTMFQASDAKTVSQYNPIQLTDAQQHDGRAFISYDPYTLEGKFVGDRIQFKVPQLGLNRSAVIDRIKVDPKEDIIAWSGHLENGDQNNENFHISQTMKDEYTIGTITTIDGGMHSIETKNGVGWISNRNDGLDKDEATPSAPQ